MSLNVADVTRDEGAVNVKLLNVFAPFIKWVTPVDEDVNETLLKVKPPPLKVTLVPPNVNKEVPAFKVKLVPSKSTAKPDPDALIVLEPKVATRVKSPLVLKVPETRSMLKFAVSNVPWASVTLRLAVFNASPKVTVMPGPKIVNPLKDLPADVIVPVPVIVFVPV